MPLLQQLQVQQPRALEGTFEQAQCSAGPVACTVVGFAPAKPATHRKAQPACLSPAVIAAVPAPFEEAWSLAVVTPPAAPVPARFLPPVGDSSLPSSGSPAAAPPPDSALPALPPAPFLLTASRSALATSASSISAPA